MFYVSIEDHRAPLNCITTETDDVWKNATVYFDLDPSVGKGIFIARLIIACIDRLTEGLRDVVTYNFTRNGKLLYENGLLRLLQKALKQASDIQRNTPA